MRFLFSFLILISPVLYAAPKAWKDARTLAKAGNKNILIFIHGSNWNKPGEKFRMKIWNQADFQNKLGTDFITLRLNYLDTPDEQQQKPSPPPRALTQGKHVEVKQKQEKLEPKQVTT